MSRILLKVKWTHVKNQSELEYIRHLMTNHIPETKIILSEQLALKAR